ncbi:MAG: UbiX family flavin prenyltransferase [Pirellulaceae bacterium]
MLAITGASGAVYATRLLCAVGGERVDSSDAQRFREGRGSAGIASRSGVQGEKLWDAIAAADRLLHVAQGSVWSVETARQQAELGLLSVHHCQDYFAPIASGSYLTAGMVICPCSGSTLSGIAHAASQNLIQRAAEVHLKEHRKLIVVPRETPLSVLQIENMHRLAQAAVVLPAAPGWYHGATSLCDLIDFVVCRILDQLGVENHAMQRWGS